LGVKTGANLLLYCLTLAFIFVAINQYMRGKREDRRIAAIVRQLAILEAQARDKSQE
jgi:hypothetical protein